MKNVILICVLILAISYSCEKDAYLPEVSINLIEMSHNVTTIRLSIENTTNGEIEYTGICYDTVKNPDLLSNQILEYGNVKEFSISNLEPNKTFYFKAFVSNRYGYTKSADFEYTSPYNEVPIVPCSVNTNTIIRNDTSYIVTSVSSNVNTFGEYELSAVSSGNMKLLFTFTKMPNNGIYNTVTDFNNYNDNEYNVKVLVQHSLFGGIAWSNQFPVDEDSLIYVENNHTDSITVSFCSITYNYNSTNYLIKGNIVNTY